MNAHHTSHRWSFAASLISILAFGTAEQDAAVLLIGIPGTIAAHLLTRGSPPKAIPRPIINIFLFAIVAWGTLDLLRGGLGVSLFSQFVTALIVVKTLDQRTPRDNAQLLTLSVFLVIGAILTSNSFAVGLITLVFIPIITASALWHQLARVEQAKNAPATTETRATARAVNLRTATTIAGAAPIAATVFLLMPREMGSTSLGTWGTPSVGSVVGFNDEVRLGRGGLISESQEPVLDMQLFDREGNPLGDIGRHYYLRGAVLHNYDPETGTWSRSGDPRHAYQMGPDPRTNPNFKTVGSSPRDWTLRQEITIRNIDTNLGHLFSVWHTSQARVSPPAQLQYSTSDAALRVSSHSGKVSYTVHSNNMLPPPTEPPELTEQERLENIIDNQRILAIASDILNANDIEPDPLLRHTRDDLAAVSALRNHLTNGTFSYTLNTISAPPGRDPIEWFLSENREGHCEYFASALALLCRTVGIDARVITGYVAVDFNESTGSYIVRASNAHAWVEAEILPGHWRTIDPTPSADLARIHEPPSGLIADARRLFNTLEFAWIRSIVGYDSNAREQLLGTDRANLHRNQLFDMLTRASRQTSRAPVAVILKAIRNALFAFCATIIICILIARQHERARRLIARAIRALARLFTGGNAETDASRTRTALLQILSNADAAKPAWVPLRTHTDHLRTTGTLTNEHAEAAARIVNTLYTQMFAETASTTDTDHTEDLDLLRRWAKSRRERSNKKQPQSR